MPTPQTSALVFSLVAALSWPQASSALNRVNRLTTTAQAGQLATVPESLAKDFPDQSLLLALEARRMDPVPKANALLRAADVAHPYRVALRGHTGGVVSAQFSANGKTVLTASWDNTARLWDVASGKELRALRGHADAVVSAQFSADSKTVLTASWDKTARLWDVASAKELRALRGHADRVVNAQFSADERRLPGPAAGSVRSRLHEEAVAAQDSSPSEGDHGADARVRPGGARSPGSPAADRRGGRMSPTRVAVKEPRQQILSVLCASYLCASYALQAGLETLDCTSRSSRTKDPLTPRRETPKVPLASHEDRPFAAPHGQTRRITVGEVPVALGGAIDGARALSTPARAAPAYPY